MKRLEKLIREMRQQLFPYHHEHDLERGEERWRISKDEYLGSWIAAQIDNCRKKNRCMKRGRCAFYSYSDLSRRNYEICREVLLRLENGEISCKITEEETE